MVYNYSYFPPPIEYNNYVKVPKLRDDEIEKAGKKQKLFTAIDFLTGL